MVGSQAAGTSAIVRRRLCGQLTTAALLHMLYLYTRFSALDTYYNASDIINNITIFVI